MTLKPEPMNKPDKIYNTGDSITITWSALEEAKTNGNEVISYKIQWLECEDSAYENCSSDWESTPTATTCDAGAASNSLLVDCEYYQSLYDITGLNANKYYKI